MKDDNMDSVTHDEATEAGAPPRLYWALGSYNGELEFTEAGIRAHASDRPLSQHPLSYWIHAPSDEREIGTAALGVGNDYLTLSPGLTLLVAPTGWGKTIFLERVLKDEALERITVGEVPSRLALEEDTLYATLPQALERCFARAWADRDGPTGALISFDSLREVVFGRSLGGTGEGGVNLFASMQFTALSNVLMLLNAKVIAAFNPLIDKTSDDGDRRWRQLMEVLRGSCAVIVGEGRTLQVFDRGPFSPNRDARQIAVPTVTLSDDRRPAAAPAATSATVLATSQGQPPRHTRSLLRAHLPAN